MQCHRCLASFERFEVPNRFETRSFSGFGMDPSNFRMKIHEISALSPKRYRNVIKSVPDVKSTLFCKVLPGRAQNCIFADFCRILIDDFRRFSRIFTYLIVFVHRFERFQEANRFETRSFSGFDMDPSNCRSQTQVDFERFQVANCCK